MDQRRVRRFSRRAILIHWLHAASFALPAVTGALMFFRLAGFGGGPGIRTVHLIAAASFVMVPLLYSLVGVRSAMGFVRDTFHWDRDDIEWIRSALAYYLGRRRQMPPQGRINGDQKLWQFIVFTTGAVLTLTGGLLWFLKLDLSLTVYQWVRLVHAAAFVAVSATFPIHFYLRSLHPKFEESLVSMLDGMVSASYARDNYSKWYATGGGTGRTSDDRQVRNSPGSSGAETDFDATSNGNTRLS